MDELQKEQVENTPSQKDPIPADPGYTPRPSWQVWAARIGLVVFLIILILYYGIMFSGGGK